MRDVIRKSLRLRQDPRTRPDGNSMHIYFTKKNNDA